MTRVALVTGANRGLGMGTAKELAIRGYHVVVTARDSTCGNLIAEKIIDQGYSADFVSLDVTRSDSIDALTHNLDARGQGLDVLVCNAGVALDGFDANVVRKTLAVNFHGAVAVAEAILPRMKPAGRVVMVSSGLGQLDTFGNELQRRFGSSTLSAAGITKLLDEFLEAVETGSHASDDWPTSAYRVSKAALNAYTRVRGPAFLDQSVLLNAVCPGWVRTDMGGAGASRALEEGVNSIIWAAELDADGPSGGFFRDGVSQPW